MSYTIKNTIAEEALPALADNSVHLVVTDPPYFIDGMDDGWDPKRIHKRKARAKTIGGLPVGMRFNPKQGHNLQKFMEPIAAEVFRVLKPGGFFISFSQARLIHRMSVAIEDQGFEIRDMLAWTHNGQPKAQGQEHHVRRKLAAGKLTEVEADAIIQSMAGRKTPQLGPSLEPMVLAMKPVEGTFVDNWIAHETGLIDTSHSLDGRFPTNLMAVPRANKDERGSFNTHLTVKPVRLIRHLINIFSKPGQVVLDPFMGSGSHGVAALRADRQFIGFEPVPEYFEISRRRLDEVVIPATSDTFLAAAE